MAAPKTDPLTGPSFENTHPVQDSLGLGDAPTPPAHATPPASPASPASGRRDKPATPSAPHAGHRARLRARFEEGGDAGVADYELLELLLFRSIPRRDLKPLAKALIARFGGVADVLSAPRARLVEVDGVSEAVAIDLAIVAAAGRRMARDRVMHKPVITSWSALLDYCRTHMADAPREQFRVLFLDKRNRLIADEVMSQGTVDHAPAYPREVVRRALELNSTAVILAHNHPSGDPTPSSADVEMTREIINAARPLGVMVHDHIVVGRERVASFKALGLL